MRSVCRLFSILLLLLQCALPLTAHAQESIDVPIVGGSAEIRAGDVFEILGVSAVPDAAYDWVLTQDGSFLEASRDPVYRTRLTQEGRYVLEGQVVTVDGIRRIRVDLTVTLRDETPETPESPDGLLDIVTADLSEGPDGIAVPLDQPVLTLTPVTAFPQPISADLDTRRDSDSDGDPENDNDVVDTLFSIEGNALRLWFVTPEAAAPMRLSTVTEDGSIVTQDIAVAGAPAPVPTGTIAVTGEYAGAVNVSFGSDDLIDPKQVVYEWDFGDGEQSLLDAPRHQYAANGEYPVRVTIRGMTTGEVLAEGETTVTIATFPQQSSSASSSSAASSVTSVPRANGGAAGSSILWTIVKILLVLLIAAGIGAVGVWGVTKFLHRESRLQKALEEADSKFLKKDGAGPATEIAIAPPTMELKRSTAPAREETIEQAIDTAKQSEGAATPPPPAPMPSADAAAPAWLQEGLKAAEQENPPAPAAVPVSQPPVATSPPGDAQPFEPGPPPLPGLLGPAPEQTVAPAPSPPTAPEAMTEEDLLPPWLKEEGDEKVSEVSEVSEVAEVSKPPAPTAEPASPPTEAAPAPQPPAPIKESTPPQLQTAEPKPEPVPAAPVKETPALPSQPKPSTSEAPAPATSSTSQTSLTSPTSDPDRLERERERKRRKRQRYRENLKKRNADAGLRPAGPRVSTDVSPPALAAPAVTAQLPSPTEPPPPIKLTPVPQDIPPAEPSMKPTAAPAADDKITFMIKAEGVEKKNSMPKNGNGKKGQKKEEK